MGVLGVTGDPIFPKCPGSLGLSNSKGISIVFLGFGRSQAKSAFGAPGGSPFPLPSCAPHKSRSAWKNFAKRPRRRPCPRQVRFIPSRLLGILGPVVSIRLALSPWRIRGFFPKAVRRPNKGFCAFRPQGFCHKCFGDGPDAGKTLAFLASRRYATRRSLRRRP